MLADGYATQIDKMTSKRLVILGLARQGKALARFAVEVGAEVVVSDLRSAEKLTSPIAELSDLPIEFVLGAHPDSLLDGTDFVAISGSVPADAPFVNKARARGIVVTNDSAEFLSRCPAPVIGITGSAGKSTTTSLLGEMGEASGVPTWVGGNLGFPLIEKLHNMSQNDIVVQELSSFQLEIWERSPHIAAILNVTPNHLDRHKTMAVYTAAKANILRRQSAEDIAILPNESLEHLFPLVQGRLRTFSMVNEVADGAFVRDGQVWLRDGEGEQAVCSLDDIQLRGKHNVLNVLAACTLADARGIPIAAMRQAIQTFTGIAHRLEQVANIDGVDYINDSIATAPERAIAAIHAFEEPLILLVGGRDKDLDWEPLVELVHARCKAVLLFGQLAPMVAKLLDNTRIIAEVAGTMKEAVARAYEMARAGDVVLLSPGGTSYDAYQDFAERGVHFRKIVNELSKAAELQAAS